MRNPNRPVPAIFAPERGTTAPVDPEQQKRRRRLRRLNTAFDRLGILDAIGRDWLGVDPDTGRIRFDDLPEGRYLALQMLLDDLAGGVRRPTSVAGRRPAVSGSATAPVRRPLFSLPGGSGPHIGGRA